MRLGNSQQITPLKTQLDQFKEYVDAKHFMTNVPHRFEMNEAVDGVPYFFVTQYFIAVDADLTEVKGGINSQHPEATIVASNGKGEVGPEVIRVDDGSAKDAFRLFRTEVIENRRPIPLGHN